MAHIKDIKIGTSTYLIEPTIYAVTEGTDSAITASITNFALDTGVVVTLKITTTNSAAATLNISSTGAKTIRYNNANIFTGALKVNNLYSFLYDGTYWQLIGSLSTDTLVNQTVQTDNTNYKILTTVSSSPTSGAAAETYYSENVYANPSTGSLSAQRLSLNLSSVDKAYMVWNNTDQSIDFIFN